MNHCGTRMLETDRLVLRPFVVGDAEAMFRNWASDPEVTKYLTWPAHANVDVTRALLKEWTAAYANPSYYQWAIVLKENGESPIGGISAVNLNDDLSIVQIGYCLGRLWWHRGIMSEALKAVIDFFFDEVGANRIESNNQGICDACWYAVLKSER